ncbi:hypothetical protein [Paractinoplanes hotanensis]|uniref:Core-binding (CB) domain-containing protein n=1 Tax=Paractinoplanes hotanensis TaxID=2906497 RepID=A0ABT0XWV0_9ACTN|nr:hypothetical protein [Actinoplanes hotanensis]MCM4078271.1 hypothetical protein [Actinoplanes hotanensis]
MQTRPSAKGTAHLLLTQLGRGEVPLTHEALDTLNTPGNGGTANHLDAILTANGVLRPRDLELARLERAIPATLATITDNEHRKILRGYATWDLLRRARTTSMNSPLTPGARHAAGERLNTATHLLDWLRERGQDLAACRQPDLDAYLTAHPTRRHNLHGFLTWAHRTRRSRKLTITEGPNPLPKTPAADDDQRWNLAHMLLHEPGYTPADRVAGLLVLLFGQRPHRISRLGIDTTTGQVTITLGTSPIKLPESLAGHVTTLLATRRARVAKRITDPGPWLFPSHTPTGRPCPPPSPTGSNASESSPATTAPQPCSTWPARCPRRPRRPPRTWPHHCPRLVHPRRAILGGLRCWPPTADSAEPDQLDAVKPRNYVEIPP